MENLNHLFHGFSIAFSFWNIVWAASGVILGIIIGVLPGLGGTSGVAILMPLTFTIPPTSGIIFLSSIYWGALFGGSITSILFNIPGEPWSVATMFDGHPLAKKGKAGVALTAAFLPGFFASLISIILFTFFAPPLANVALQFGPPENFAVLLLAFSTFAGLGSGSIFKTLISTCIGFLLTAVGLDIISGHPRLTFGNIQILSGFSFVTATIGLYGIGEILYAAEESLKFEGAKVWVKLRDIGEVIVVLARRAQIFIQGTLLGFWIGVMPGTGATPASFLSYGVAKRTSKNPEQFGTGIPEGVMATESAAHAAGIGSLLPLVTLGIPGSPTAAVMLVGMYIWGLQPGPRLFLDKPDFVWGFIASMYIGNIIGLILCLSLVPFFAAILRMPYAILTPLIVLLCVIGAYTVNNSMLDIWLLLVFGVMGYLFKKFNYPIAPLVVAMVLGDITENALRQSLIMSDGSFAIFFRWPYAAFFMTIALTLFFLPAILNLAKRFRGQPPTATAELSGDS
ncbi:tripartite tricarboxylate transporter permease [Candidatus Acetothermia bacterium]|nr:tripartite tricarboxylate transporter permease [Candidatus Acetothermia bacterium]